MRVATACAVLLCATAAAADPTGRAVDPGLQTLRPAYRDAYQAVRGRPRYELTARVEGERFAGTLRLTYTNRRTQDVGAIDLELFPEAWRPGGGLLGVGRVSADGAPLATQRHGRGRLRVWLRRLLPPGERRVLTIAFSGRLPPLVGQPATRASLPFGRLDGRVYLFAWHPVLALETPAGWRAPTADPGPGDLYSAEVADYRVDLDLPSDLEPVAPGVLLTDRTTGDRRRRVWVAAGLRDFTVIAARGLRRLHGRAGEIELTVAYRPGRAAIARDVLTATRESVELFNRAFGEYPYRRLTLVVGPLPHHGGMEHSTVAVVSDNPLPVVFRMVAVHEVAHQWWYLLVGSDQQGCPFLDEALASYSELLFIDRLLGRAALARQLGGRFGAPATRRRYLLPSADYPGMGSLVRTVYIAGARWHWLLAERRGEAAYHAALRAYVSRHRWGLATPEDLAECLVVGAGAAERGLVRALLAERPRTRRR